MRETIEIVLSFAAIILGVVILLAEPYHGFFTSLVRVLVGVALVTAGLRTPLGDSALGDSY
jgi:hypothetical protein